jgi:hypothetical protein
MADKNELDRESKLQSFIAAQNFVRKSLGHSNSGETTCEIAIDNYCTIDNLGITLVDHIPAYSFSCDLFYSFQIRSPLWTSYHLFKWDKNTEELTLIYDGKEIFFVATTS